MKYASLILLSLCLSSQSFAQSETDKAAITKACMNYIEGFYQGDSTKLIESVKPELHKMGFMKNRSSGKYRNSGYMTYQQAIDYANNVLKSKKFASDKAPKKVEILDISNHIASTKITAWWGIDYMLLSKVGDKWMIEQVLWEGPLQK